MATANTYVNVKRVFNTQPEVMGFVINVGEVVNARMMTRPLMTVLLSIQAGLVLSFGVMMSCQVGGRWGSSTGVNNFVFAGFGIPFGLTFIVLSGAEIIVRGARVLRPRDFGRGTAASSPPRTDLARITRRNV